MKVCLIPEFTIGISEHEFMTFLDYMMENILGPLEMTDSGFKFTESVVNHTAIGFYANGTVAPLYNTGK